MTRFLLSLDRAVDTVFEALLSKHRGATFVPKVPSAKIADVAAALMNGREVPIVYTGIRPGEKIHEIMVSEEECFRTIEENGYYVIHPVLPELRDGEDEIEPALVSEYSSKDDNISVDELRELLTDSSAEIGRFLSAE
jgi:UDP-glucose 4-epimerase